MLSDQEDGIATRLGIAVKEVRRLEDEIERAFGELLSATEKAAAFEMYVTSRFAPPIEAAFKVWKQRFRDANPHLEVGRVWRDDETIEAPVGEDRAA